MSERHIRGRYKDMILKIISRRECDDEIGDNSLIIDVYGFARGRSVHVFYSLYDSNNKGVMIVTR